MDPVRGAEIVLQLSSPTAIEIFQTVAKLRNSHFQKYGTIPLSHSIGENFLLARCLAGRRRVPKIGLDITHFEGPELDAYHLVSAGQQSRQPALLTLLTFRQPSNLTADLIAEAELRPGSYCVQDFKYIITGRFSPKRSSESASSQVAHRHVSFILLCLFGEATAGEKGIKRHLVPLEISNGKVIMLNTRSKMPKPPG
jgi:hypothetical protein